MQEAGRRKAGQSQSKCRYAMVTAMHWALGEKLMNNFGINRITLQTKVFILERNKLMQITVHEMVALGLRGSCLCLSIYC